jgi:uncharacterized protein (DUF934 family)
MRFVPLHDPGWHRLHGEDGPQPHPAPRDHALLTLEQWHAVRDTWPQGLCTGIELPNTADALALEADLPRLSLLVLGFPKWTDGRAYSQARLLRGRLRYAGELRATGDVVADMLPLLQRTGFSSVQLRAGQSETHARRALHFFTGHYQGDLVQPQPLFARSAR